MIRRRFMGHVASSPRYDRGLRRPGRAARGFPCWLIFVAFAAFMTTIGITITIDQVVRMVRHATGEVRSVIPGDPVRPPPRRGGRRAGGSEGRQGAAPAEPRRRGRLAGEAIEEAGLRGREGGFPGPEILREDWIVDPEQREVAVLLRGGEGPGARWEERVDRGEEAIGGDRLPRIAVAVEAFWAGVSED
ncbi:hypothetical protein [Tautonia plasticadhaerens]|uniref:Uncharacterized protein n=1 Tax=Tautonia plasticadhaerens TaxID=2527974 RepID=A0A518GUL8_9BACT|nr:hypothetical protein [Tautonia plasticadhaerens]QDV32280.1 hypothetical protein ElP_01080 [Tautonia plasticadhaerens]